MVRVGLLYDRRLEGTAVTELESVIPVQNLSTLAG